MAKQDGTYPYQGEYQKQHSETDRCQVFSSFSFLNLFIPVWHVVVFHEAVLEQAVSLSIFQRQPRAFNVAHKQWWEKERSTMIKEQWEYNNFKSTFVNLSRNKIFLIYLAFALFYFFRAKIPFFVTV